MDEIACRLALWRAPGVGPAAFADLVERFGSAESTFSEGTRAPLPEALRTYLRRPDWGGVERDLAWSEQPDCAIVWSTDPDYPAALRAIADGPPVLFVRGNRAALEAPQVAVVGSRKPTPGGRDAAFDFARQLARVGMTVTSGLALGIDGAAHRGALAAGGQTIAVGGTGPDRIYPSRHVELAEAIVVSDGVLVSEFPTGTPPAPANFPRRNRLISGLSLGVLVVEAALRSGSLITARLAGEQGREVFAIPGAIHNPLAKGCHRLIRDGAKLVESTRDILEEMSPQLLEKLSQPDGFDEHRKPAGRNGVTELSEDCRTLLEALGYEPTPVDRLVERTRLTAEAVSSILLTLELQGLVEPTPGNCYIRRKRA